MTGHRAIITRARPVCRTKQTIRGYKYKYPTTVAGKKKLFEQARSYFERLRANPDMKKHKLHYKYHYAYYGSRPKQMKRRNIHVRHRRMLEKTGKVRKYDGKEIDHMRPHSLAFSSIVVRKNRCSHNLAHGLQCNDPEYKPKRRRRIPRKIT